MSNSNTVGQSKATIWKEICIQTCLQNSIQRGNRVIHEHGGNRPFFCFDLFAGDGKNKFGSGTVKLANKALHCSINGVKLSKVHIVGEKCEINYKSLVSECSELRNITILNTDCCDFAYNIPGIIKNNFFETPSKAVGFVILDVNGTIKPQYWEAFRYLAEKCPNLDILSNWLVSSIKRNRHAFPHLYTERNMQDFINHMPHKHSYVGARHKAPDKPSIWSMLLFTNNYPKVGLRKKSIRFYKTTSNKGKEIVRNNDGFSTQKYLFKAMGEI